MGRGVLAAGLAGSEPGLGAGDTFGISCIRSQTPSGTGGDAGFLDFSRIFYQPDHGRFPSRCVYGDLSRRAGGRDLPGAPASGTGSADHKIDSSGLFYNPGPDLGVFRGSLCCDLFSYGISCSLYQCAQRHRKYGQEASGDGRCV